MRSAITRGVAAAAILALGTALQAANGVIITQKVTMGDSTRTTQVQFDANHMRAETPGARGESQVVIFDGAKQVLYIVNPERKTYSEMTKADADKLGAQVNDAMAQMQAQMANMPPEQRAQIEAMMKGRGMGAAMGGAAKPEYKKVGTDTVGKWTCDKYEGYVNGQKTMDLCTVDPKVLGFTPADFAVTRQMADFFSRIMPQGASRIFSIGDLATQGYAGIPIRTTTSMMGRTSTSELQDIQRGSIPESAFEVPAGFQKEPFMGGMGRGRQ